YVTQAGGKVLRAKSDINVQPSDGQPIDGETACVCWRYLSVYTQIAHVHRLPVSVISPQEGRQRMRNAQVGNFNVERIYESRTSGNRRATRCEMNIPQIATHVLRPVLTYQCANL